MPAHAHGVRYLRGRLPFTARGGGWKPPFHGLRGDWYTPVLEEVTFSGAFFEKAAKIAVFTLKKRHILLILY